jgi:molybdate transport system ATP-binding protein
MGGGSVAALDVNTSRLEKDSDMSLLARLQKRLSSGFALDVEFSIPPGITMLFGASGSGKTTLLRCVAGLLLPDSGLIKVGDEVLFDSDRRLDVSVQERKVGFVFQNLALFPHLTVAQNIGYGLRNLDQDQVRKRTENILKSFRISGLWKHKPNEISGGERQRVALARTLVTDPCLLLLDEPLSALDYSTQSQIIDDLRVWNAAHGIPILYVTHSQREVFALGERVIVLQVGQILSQGTPQDVLDAPTQESLAQLAGFENFFDAIVLSVTPGSGTMHCRLVGAETEVEVPLSKVVVGSTLRLAIRGGDILVAAELPRALSARNVLPGRIRSLKREGAMVIAEVEAGKNFEVHLTPSACDSLGLGVGRQVWLVIKTHSFRLMTAKAV